MFQETIFPYTRRLKGSKAIINFFITEACPKNFVTDEVFFRPPLCTFSVTQRAGRGEQAGPLS